MTQSTAPRTPAAPPLDPRGRIELALWALAWFVSPLYLMPQGLPQLYDALLGALCLGLLVSGRLVFSRRAAPPVAALGMLVVYTAAVGCVWATIYEAPAFLVPSAYYGFDLAVMIVGLSLFQRHGPRFLRVTLWAWVAALMVQAVLVTVMPPGYAGVRSLAFFNNPNQLAVYGIAGGVLVVQVARRVGAKPIVEYLSLALVGVLVVGSVSRAGVLAYVTLLAVRFTSRPKTIIAGAAIGVLVVLLFPWESLPLDFVQERLSESAEESAATLAHDRGYTRIIEEPQYLLLGAGEGLMSRFGQRIEIHSTPGTLLFCYGIPGTLLFFGACVSVVMGARRGDGIVLLPLLVLSMFHHTLRVRFFWLNLALAVVSGLAKLPRAARVPRKEIGAEP